MSKLQRGFARSANERPQILKMWSFFKKIFGRFSSGGESYDSSALLPQGVDKLRREHQASEELEGPGGPITAREAFELSEEIIKSFDPEARLTKLQSKGKLDPTGRAEGWAFEFLLPTRWGQGQFLFACSKEAAETVTVKLKPFAAEGSALDKMLEEGQAGFVEQQWKVEMERQSPLSHDFQDSSDVLSAWQLQGKAVDYNLPVTLRAVVPPLGKPRWELLESARSKKSLYTLPIE